MNRTVGRILQAIIVAFGVLFLGPIITLAVGMGVLLCGFYLLIVLDRAVCKRFLTKEEFMRKRNLIPTLDELRAKEKDGG